jgi:hypothetical protein
VDEAMPVHVGTAVLVTGDTYEKKAKLLAVGRGPCRNAVQTSASWLSRGSCQRQSVPPAAANLGQPRPISRSGLADRPYQGLAFDTGGGHWCKQLNGWIFPEAKREQVVAAMGDDISEEQVVHAPKPSVDANATLLVSRHKKARPLHCSAASTHA